MWTVTVLGVVVCYIVSDILHVYIDLFCGVLCYDCLAVLRLVRGLVPAPDLKSHLVIKHGAVPHVVWSVRAPLVAVVTYTRM